MTPQQIIAAGPEILLQTPHYIILNKPAGLPVHPGPSGGPSVETWFPLLSRRADGPWLAHRLDTGTAGCLLIALRKTPLRAAQSLFASGQVQKTYWAIVQGALTQPSGTIDTPLAKQTTKSGWRMIPTPEGKPATTHWRLRGQTPTLAWLELHPKTGRTHQIRAHCALIGHPILNDPIYAPPPNPDPNAPLQLLARSITLPLTPPLHATAPIPPHMRPNLQACGLT